MPPATCCLPIGPEGPEPRVLGIRASKLSYFGRLIFVASNDSDANIWDPPTPASRVLRPTFPFSLFLSLTHAFSPSLSLSLQNPTTSPPTPRICSLRGGFNMRETGSLHEEMINRNWVLKRKRKRVSSGLDVSKKRGSASRGSDSPKSRSVKIKLGDVEVSDVGDKMKGNDGDDFECDVCGRGGDLLCCESCQRTYHLECLNPPLKRAPHGKWQCYRCCEEDKDVKPPSKSSSRRARSKSNFEKSKSVNKLSGNFDKASVSGQSLVVQRDKLDTDNTLLPVSAPSIERNLECHQVAKSYSPKSSRSGDSGSRQHVSPEGDSRINKKGSSLLRKTNSHEESCTLIETSNTDAKTESSKGQGIPTRNVKRRNKNILSLVRSTQISKEDRQKFNGFDKKKSSRTHKEKHAAAVSNTISKETYLLPETRRSLRKPKPFDRRDYASLSKEESRVTKSAIKKHAKMLPHEQSTSSHGVDKKIKFHENVLEGVQQVDRVLGCRVQPNSVISSSHSQAIKSSVSVAIRESEIDSGKSAANILQSSNSIDSENGHKLLEKNSVGKVQNMGDVETLHDEDMDYNNAASEEKTHETKDSKDQDKDNAMMFATEPSQDVHTVQTGCEAQGESVKAESEDITRGPSEDVNIAESSCKVEEESVKIDSKEIMNGKIPVEMLDKSLKNIKPILAEQELGSQNKNAVAYEFLVKWVGQSNIHNSWISESQLKVLAKRKLENYKAKYGTALINISEEQWCKPQRVIALRVSKGGAREVLTKWCGLPYDECTWERLDEPIIKKYAHLVTQFEQFESQTLEKNARDVIPRVKVDCDEVASLTEQPKELQGGSLFPHQLEALNWLRKCWHKSRNVILADEMGLGKTVSASAFISSLYIEFKVNLPCLVLVPLSTMPNWLAEFALWAPHLNVVEYHGPAIARSIIRQYEWHANDPDKSRWVPMAYKFNVLLTTYEMVLADSSHLRGVPWEVLIVDEGHRLKNSSSKLFSLLNTFSFQHRVLLTGTPLQNNIGEMYNLLNFLQPLSFPSLSAFEENFNDLTTAEKVDELKKLVAPHMLRRLKKDAMQNIPPKTERMVPVELTSIQAEYYRAMLTKNYQILRNVGKGVPQQSMLNIIMQLRKVCNHPYLIPGTEPESGSIEFLQEMRIKASAKLTLLHSMLKSLHKEGHRVLIFSQMTKLLDILEDYLVIEFGPKTYERVDGSVSVADRQTSIARFNQDKSRFVFLLSTRSCGLGINLATADTVIIYDSDFNPHADIQAMNRAHRIGQSNRLLVYRLVVRASVEERILQLAKRKLMLDQLFVNKAESQKEVEDIIRWGTEELFNDCDGVNGHNLNEPSTSQLETVTEGEHKHRRRSGGLGDVYQDKCTNGSTKIVWDDNAIMKLLDRTNLPTSVSESADGELENDMLGTVKSLDWNDELNDELGETELLRTVTEGGCDQSSEVREDNAINATEENDWDRLLRVRWERYQTEEEAALGRGKRLRKAVSYKEAYATMPNEVLSESGNEGEEPEPVYTPAGRALKEKYSKLRARQKQRIAHRFTTEALLREPEEPSVREAQSLDGNIHADDAREEDSPLNLVETNISQPFESKSGRIDSIFKAGRLSKHGFKRHHSNHLDLSVDPSPPPDLLPVLGLCAPNANRMNSVHRKPHSTVNKSTDEHTQSSPQPASSQGNDLNIGRSNPTGDQSLFSDMFGEALQHRRKHILPDYFPFYPLPPNMPGRVPPDPQESSAGSFSSFHERFGLANLTPEENPFLPFPLPSRNAMKPPPDCFPSLSLGRNLDGSPQNLSKIPLPILTVDSLKQKQIMGELPPMPGLGQMQITHPLLPENHKKVLDSIMLRTQSNKFLKKRINVDEWSEDELDALWIGVRRHGRGNWAAMLRDSKLKFSQSKTPDDLASRWIVEEPKIMGRSAFPEPKLSKPLSISDGMRSKALFGSNFANVGGETLKFRSHLSDIQQACGDFIKGFPFTQLGSLGAVNSSYPPMPAWLSNKMGSSNSSDFHVAPFHRSELPLDHPFQLHPIQGTSLESHSMNMSSSGRSRQNEDELRGSKKPKLPFFLDKSLNLLRDTHNNFQSTGSSMGMPPNLKMKQVSVTSPSDAQGSSKADALPHWLREAVSVPHPKAPEPHLPPTVSAIAQSVRILYGEKKPAIPPFSIPGPLPLQPKDPRKKFKKKKLQRSLQEMPEIVKSNMEPDTGTSLPALNLNLNLNSPSSSPSDTKVKKLSVELSIQATPDMSNSSCKNNELPLPDNLENFELVEKGVVEEESQKEQEASISQESKHKQVDPVESRDLCMTRSDHGGDHLIQANEISSKETVSDEHKSEQEP